MSNNNRFWMSKKVPSLKRAWVVGEAATVRGAQARSHVCSAMPHKPDSKPSQPPEVRAEVARMQAGAAPQPPSPASSATSADVSSPSSPESPETVRREGPGATWRHRGEGAMVGKGEGGDKRGQAEAGRDTAEGVAAGAERQGEGQGQRAAEGPRPDPFNVAD